VIDSTAPARISSQQGFGSVQGLRALAALMVVAWHSHLAIKHFHSDYWIEAIPEVRRALYPFFLNHLYAGVDIFFCISGFIMCMLVVGGRESTFCNYILRRFIRIFPMYWIFSLFIILAYGLNKNFNLGGFTGNLTEDAQHILSSIFLYPQGGYPILIVGWTLVYEMLFYYSIALLLLFKGGAKHVVTWIFMLCAVSLVQYITNSTILNNHVFNIFIIEFFFGAIAYRCYKSVSKHAPAMLILSAVVLYFVLCFMLDRLRIAEDTPPTLLRVVGFGLVGALLISGAIGLERTWTSPMPTLTTLFRRIGDASYVLYLSHWFILSTLGKLGGLLPNLHQAGIVLWHVACVVATIGFALVCHHVVEKPLTTRLRRSLTAFLSTTPIFPQDTLRHPARSASGGAP
jgi:peptidoglycan/LPS O-acetylase OafA/YrhL